jgi:hypothetical protein
MEIIKLNPEEFGLTDETARNIKDQFQPMLNKMVELENEYNQVINMPIEEAETQKLAKQIRLKYKEVRLKTAEIHKAQKSFYLNGGRFVDGWKNAQLFASQGKEEALESIEKYEENHRKQLEKELHEQRKTLLMPYITELEAGTLPNLGNMEDIVWDAFYSSRISVYESRMEAKRKAEEQAKIEADRKHLHDQRKAKLMDYWHLLDAEVKQMDFSTMTDKYFNGLFADMERRKQEHDQEQHRLREENEAMRKKQEEAELERRKLSEELERKEKEFREAQRLQQIEEEKARKEALKLAKAPIKKRLSKWVADCDLAEIDFENEVTETIKSKLLSFKGWALNQIENM